MSFSSKSNKRSKLIFIFIAVITIVLVASAVIFILNFWHENTLISAVKNDLNKVASAMESDHAKTGAYPASIPDINAKNSKLSGGSSFDGTTYCISSVSSIDKKIVFHINSTSPNNPQSGSCVTGSDIPIPSIPGNLAIAFATISNIKLTWDTSLYATTYQLQCAVDNKFTKVESGKNVTVTAGICNNLKPNTIYYCRVRAINKKGDSPWSTSVAMATLTR